MIMRFRGEKEIVQSPLSPSVCWISFERVCVLAKTNLSNTIRPSHFFGFCYFLENTNFVPRQTLASSIMSPNGKLSKSWVNTDGISGFLSIKKKTLKRKHQKENIKKKTSKRKH